MVCIAICIYRKRKIRYLSHERTQETIKKNKHNERTHKHNNSRRTKDMRTRNERHTQKKHMILTRGIIPTNHEDRTPKRGEHEDDTEESGKPHQTYMRMISGIRQA